MNKRFRVFGILLVVLVVVTGLVGGWYFRPKSYTTTITEPRVRLVKSTVDVQREIKINGQLTTITIPEQEFLVVYEMGVRTLQHVVNPIDHVKYCLLVLVLMFVAIYCTFVFFSWIYHRIHHPGSRTRDHVDTERRLDKILSFMFGVVVVIFASFNFHPQAESIHDSAVTSPPQGIEADFRPSLPQEPAEIPPIKDQ